MHPRQLSVGGRDQPPQLVAHFAGQRVGRMGRQDLPAPRRPQPLIISAPAETLASVESASSTAACQPGSLAPLAMVPMFIAKLKWWAICVAAAART